MRRAASATTSAWTTCRWCPPSAICAASWMVAPGAGAGFNDIVLSVAMVPADDDAAPTLVRTATQTVRYPVGGIREPADGVIRFAPEDLVEACGTVVVQP